jgi:hypothetical protein
MFYNVRYTNIPGAKHRCHYEVVNLVSHTQEEALREASKRSGIPLSMLRGAWAAVTDVMGDWVQAGEGFTTDIVNGRPAIVGPADSPDAIYNPDVNEVRYHVFPGTALAARVPLITPHKAGGTLHGPVVNGAYDVHSQTYNLKLSPLFTLRVTGNGLKIAGTVPDVGIDFLASSGAVFPADLRELSVNKPSELVFRIPDMPDDSYKMRITTAYVNGSKLLKTPHSTIYEHVLWVGPIPEGKGPAGNNAAEGGSPDSDSGGAEASEGGGTDGTKDESPPPDSGGEAASEGGGTPTDSG